MNNLSKEVLVSFDLNYIKEDQLFKLMCGGRYDVVNVNFQNYPLEKALEILQNPENNVPKDTSPAMVNPDERIPKDHKFTVRNLKVELLNSSIQPQSEVTRLDGFSVSGGKKTEIIINQLSKIQLKSLLEISLSCISKNFNQEDLIKLPEELKNRFKVENKNIT